MKFKVLPITIAISMLGVLGSVTYAQSEGAVDAPLGQVVAADSQGQLAVVPAYNAPLNSWLSGVVWGNQIPKQGQSVDQATLKPIYAWPMTYAMTQADSSKGSRAVLAFGHPSTTVTQHTPQAPTTKNQGYVFDWDAATKTTAFAQAIPNDFYLSVLDANLSAPRVEVLNGSNCSAQSEACKVGYAAKLHFAVQPVGQTSANAAVTLTLAQGSPFAQFTVENGTSNDLTLLLQVNGQLQNTLDPSQSSTVSYSNSNMKLNVAPIFLKTFNGKSSHAYGLYTPESQQAPTSVAQDLPKNTIQIIAKPGISHFVVADLNTQGANYVLGSSDSCSSNSNQKVTINCAAQGIGQYAMNAITGSDYRWAVDGKQVVTSFALNTQSLYDGQTQVPVLLALYPHQYSRLSEGSQGQTQQNYDVLNVAGDHNSTPVSLVRLSQNPNSNGAVSTIQTSSVYLTAMGQPLRLVAGTSFTTRYPLPNISPAVLSLPKSDQQGILAVSKAADAWYAESQKTHFGLDPKQDAIDVEAAGKIFYQDSNMVALFVALSQETTNQKAAALNLTKAATVAQAVGDGLNRYLGDTSDVGFQYNSALASMVSKTSAPALNRSNAHPEVYGYFVNAYANLLAQAPALKNEQLTQSLKTLLPAVQHLQNDYAGQCQGDQANQGCNTQQPQAFLRNWDAYAGHSWSTGPVVSNMGPSLQNMGESLNADRGLIQLGSLTQNPAMKNLGLYLYTTEQQANQFYWQDLNAHYLSLQDTNNQARYALKTDPTQLGSFAAIVGAGGIGLAAHGTADPYGLLVTSFWPLTANANEFSAQWLQRLDALAKIRTADSASLSAATKSWSILPTKQNGGYAAEGNANVAPWYTIAHSSYEGVVDELIGNADPAQGLLQFAAWKASRYPYADKQGQVRMLPNLPLGQTIPQVYNNLRVLTDAAVKGKQIYPALPTNVAFDSKSNALCWNGMSVKDAQKQNLGTITYRAYLFPAPGKVDVVSTPTKDGRFCTQPFDLKAAQAEAKNRGLPFVTAAVMAQSSEGGSSEVVTMKLDVNSYPAPSGSVFDAPQDNLPPVINVADTLTQSSVMLQSTGVIYCPQGTTCSDTDGSGYIYPTGYALAVLEGEKSQADCQASLDGATPTEPLPAPWVIARSVMEKQNGKLINYSVMPFGGLKPNIEYTFCTFAGYGGQEDPHNAPASEIFSEPSPMAMPIYFMTPSGIQPVTPNFVTTPPPSSDSSGYSLPVSWAVPLDTNPGITSPGISEGSPPPSGFTYTSVLCAASDVSSTTCTKAIKSVTGKNANTTFTGVLGNQTYQTIVTATENPYTPVGTTPNPTYSSTAVTTTPFVAAILPLAAPTGLSAVQGTPLAETVPVTISWTASQDPNVGAVVSYEVKAISADHKNDQDIKNVTSGVILDLPLGGVQYTEFDVIATDNLENPAVTATATGLTTPLFTLQSPTISNVQLGKPGLSTIPLTVTWTPSPDNNVGAMMTYTVTAVSADGTQDVSKTKSNVAPCTKTCESQTTKLDLPLGGIAYSKVTVVEQDTLSAQADANYPYDIRTPDGSGHGVLSPPTDGSAKSNPYSGTETLVWKASSAIDPVLGTIYATGYVVEVIGGKNDGYKIRLPSAQAAFACAKNGGSEMYCYTVMPGYGAAYVVTGYYNENGLKLYSPPLKISTTAQVAKSTKPTKSTRP